MNLYNTLAKNTEQARENKTKKAKQKAEEILTSYLEKTLIEESNKGKNKTELDFSGTPKETLQELQKILKNQGLFVELLCNAKMIISWSEKDFKKSTPSEVFRWYDLVNTIDEYHSQVSFSSTSLEKVKQEMQKHSDWYKGNGTGQIIERVVTEKDGVMKIQNNEVYKKI
jgi:hypothetical protein